MDQGVGGGKGGARLINIESLVMAKAFSMQKERDVKPMNPCFLFFVFVKYKMWATWRLSPDHLRDPDRWADEGGREAIEKGRE